VTCFAAVDLGGQSGRVVLGRVHRDRLRYREVHRFANVPLEVSTDDGPRWHWDTGALWEQTLDGLAAAVRAAAALGDRLAGIGVDSWGVDYGLVSAAGDLITPATHHRSASSELVTAADALVPAAEAWARTGIEKAPMNTSGRLAADARAGLLAPGVTALLTPDLFTCWLTGARGAERTIASTTELLDVRTGDWALDLAKRWGIDPAVLPPVVPAGSHAGVTLADVTARLGADAPVPVYRVASHDTASAVAAATSTAGRDGVVSCGSWALAGCIAAEPALGERARCAGYTNEAAADGRTLLLRNLSGLWLLESCLSAWASDSASAGGHDSARAGGHDSAWASGHDSAWASGHDSARAGGHDRPARRAELLAAAAALPSGGPVVDVGDPALRAPGDMPARLAALTGCDLSPAQTVRCILDSLAGAFATALSVAAGLTGVAMERVHLLGGGSRVTALARSTARATGLPVVAGPAEATSIGNLMVQAVAAGAFDSLDSARAATDHGADAPVLEEP
jgi:rhamnulokinase